MLKVILFFIFIFFAAIFSIWLMEDSSYIIINWLGYEITATTPAAILVLILSFLVIYQIAKLLVFAKNINKNIKTSKRIKNYQKLIENLNTITAQLLTNNTKKTERLILKSRKLLNPKERKCLSTVEAFLLYKKGNLEKAIKNLAKTTELNEAKEFFISKTIEDAEIKNDEQKVVELAQNLISMNTRQPLPYIKLIKIYLKNGSYKKAKEVLDSGIKGRVLGRKSPEIKNYSTIINTLLSKESLKKGNTDEALTYSNEALKIDNNFTPALFYKMKCLYLKNSIFRLKLLMDSSWKKVPHVSFITIYNKLFEGGNSKERFKAIQNIYKKNPKDELSNILLLKSAIDNDKIKEARVLINETMKEYTNKTLYAIIEILSEYEKGDIYKTKKFLEENYMEYSINHNWEFEYKDDLNLKDLFVWGN